MLLVLATPVMAYQGPYSQDESVSFPSNCLNSDKEFINASQNMSVFYPNGSIFINNSPMNQITPGQFQLNFTTPNVTGTYSVAKTCRADDGTTAQGGDSFEVIDLEEAVGMTQVATLIGLLLITSGLFYLAQRHNKMGGLYKLLSPGFHLLGMWSLMLPLLYISNAGILDPLGDTVMFIGLVSTVVYSLVYMPLTILKLTGQFLWNTSTKIVRGGRNG